ERSVNRIDDAIAPYTRFVRSSQTKLTGLQTDLSAIDNELGTLSHRIGDAPNVPAKSAAS
ncbi:MAG: hypothetical protein H0V37_13200, partial [Chloroflexia bacterium]|nr:hypothetical protein [Chloroflexia bacterium]